MMKKLIALFLAAIMVVPALASCTKTPGDPNNPADTSNPGEVVANKTYTYQDHVGVMATNWNPHTYQTTDDAYPADFLRVGLYGFIFNDELHPVEGKEPYSGYKIIPEMAKSEPVDVTEQIKKSHPQFKIPESATSGYAYTIDLNPNATWEDGTQINADTYVESMKLLLKPELLNYRATDYYANDLCIAGAEFYANQGQSVTISVANVIANEGLATDEKAEAFLAVHGEEKAWINYAYSFGFGYDFDKYPWDGTFHAEATEGVEFANEIVETPLTLNQMHDFYVQANLAMGNDEATANAWFFDEVSCKWTYPSDVDFSTVGLFKSGDYQITIVFGKALAGFNLLYNLTGNWIVDVDLYNANLKQDGDAWTNTYNTSVETTKSYGPYKLVQFQDGKFMRFEKNENWYGYTDGQHKYVDPNDGKTYDMYMTTAIECEVVEEPATQKMMFLKGELMTYGLQKEDFDTYRSSDYAYASPSETIYFFIFNGYKDAIQNRENNEGFDKTKNDLETLTLTSFRKAVAVSYDKDLFASTVSPARSAGFGLIGTQFIYNPDTGAKYRDSEQAKKVLCDFYSVDVSKFSSLDEAVDSITGYDPEAAKVLYKQAFDEALELGYITDNDGDGKCDQVISIEYCASVINDFMTTTVDYLNLKMKEVTVGTPFEDKIQFVLSAPYGTEWSQKIKSGLSDVVLAGWSGSALNPFGVTDVYVNPSYQYDAKWFDSSTVSFPLTLNVAKIGEAENIQTVTMTLRQWSNCLNGATVTIDGVDYNFGDGIVDVETRLDILAAIEGQILSTYDYIPMLQNGSMFLLTKQAYYVVEEYNAILGRGGITYLKYNYDDAAWAEYVASQNGELKY